MKRHGRDINRFRLADILRRRDDGVRSRDGIPDIRRLIVAELDPIRAARVRDGNQMTPGQRFHRHRRLFDSFVPQNAQVHFAIRGRVIPKNNGPIDIPINKKRVRIARDREEKRSTVGARKFSELFVIRHPVASWRSRSRNERARR